MLTLGFALCFILVTTAVWLAVRILFMVPVVFFSVLAALLLTGLLQPARELFERWHLPRVLAALLSMLALLLVVGAVLAFVVRRAFDQMPDLADAASDALGRLERFLVGPPLSMPEQHVESLQEQLESQLRQFGSGSAWSAANMAVDVVSGVVLALVVTFFLLKDGAKMWGWALAWAPSAHRQTFDRLGHTVWETLTGYARGMTAVAAVDAAGIGAGLFILGVPLAASLTLLVFLGAFVPIAGALLVGALAVGVTAVTLGMWQAVVVLGLVILVQQVEGNVLHPVIMSHQVELHAVVIILAVTAGALLGGIGGAVAAVPLLAIVYRAVATLWGPGARRP